METLYRNKKTLGLYRILFTVLDATNSREGEVMVIYQSEATGERYARDLTEFSQKFEEVIDDGDTLAS